MYLIRDNCRHRGGFLRLICKVILPFLALWLVTLLLYTDILNCDELEKDRNGWKSIKKKGGIEVFSRKVKDLDFKEFKGITRINASLASLLALMNDTPAYTSWLHFCKDAKLISQASKTERYLYLVYDVSRVPRVKDRDVIIRSRVFQDPDNGAINIKLERATSDELTDIIEPGFIMKAGSVRVRGLKASWMFTPVEDGYTHVIYQVYVDPAPSKSIRWRVNPTIEKLAYKTLKNMRNIVNKAKYKEADPEIIKEIPKQKS